eukprot:TRINITY_DN47715_c0_g1_i1.p1 TRINITY_DN47715_c0_g1~~TRINITY_DN47715_c0_g1_i1.p1  ORF type:complete len:402 (+),score=109.91 TRINITY_DN47715_c0_g1_i1:51-1256(+)
MALLLAAAAASAATGCADDSGCSLNGVCRNGSCRCDAAWDGPTCSRLVLLPAKVDNGYRKTGDESSWGGSVVRDGGEWRMFVEELVGGCGLNTYARNMRITHASSPTPDGPYTPVSQVTSYSASTPHVVRSPGGGYLVFATGCGTELCPTVTECGNGTTNAGADMTPCPSVVEHAMPCGCPFAGKSKPWPQCAVDWGTNVFSADSPDGPWTLTHLLDPTHPLRPHDGAAGNTSYGNPSALILPNGTTLLAFRDYFGDRRFPDSNVLGIAVAPSWQGPYRFPDAARISLSAHDAEDPHIYRDRRGNFHMLVHALDNWPNGTFVGGHVFSENGLDWTFSSEPTYNTTVQYEDGEAVVYSRRERPEMVLDPDTGVPTHLITGVVERGGPGQSDRSFTLVQPIRV